VGSRSRCVWVVRLLAFCLAAAFAAVSLALSGGCVRSGWPLLPAPPSGTSVYVSVSALRYRSRTGDILMYRTASTETQTLQTGYDRPRKPEINIIEFKFVRDTTPTLNATNPHQQHSRLVTLLRAKHPEANIHPRIILLGIAGTIYNEYTIRQLQQLGVRGPQLKTTLHKMQRIAIQDLHATWQTRQAKLRPPKQAQGTQPPPAPQTLRPPQQGGRPHHPPGGETPGT
jgi:hypothetical protein